MTTATLPIAHVVAVLVRRDGTSEIVVLCPYGQHRHRHRWERDEPPGIRAAPCRGRRPYRVGQVPAPHLMDAVRLIRQAGGWMMSRPWTQQCTAEQLRRISGAARNLAAQVSAAAGADPTIWDYPDTWIPEEGDHE